MKTLIKISLSLFSVILIYFIIWFGWGSYTKSYIKSAISNNFLSGITFSYDKITLSGFPFNLNFTIKDLVSEHQNGIKIVLPKVVIATNFSIKKLNISLDKELYISSKDTPTLVVHFKEGGAHISATLYSSALALLTASEKFNLTEISTINYIDYGFSITNPEQHQKIFISNANSIKIHSFLTATNDYTLRIKSNLNGRGSIYLDNKKIRGENFLNTDIIISINFNKNESITNVDESYNNTAYVSPTHTSFINNMNINFINFILSSDNYATNITGHMNYKRHFGFDGQVNISITDLSEFFSFLGFFMNETHSQKFLKIIKTMNNHPNTNENQVSFRITGNKNNLMWGNLSDYNFTKMLLQ